MLKTLTSIMRQMRLNIDSPGEDPDGDSLDKDNDIDNNTMCI